MSWSWFNIMCYPDIWNWECIKKPNNSFPALSRYAPHPVDKGPLPASSPNNQISCTPTNGFYFPVNPWNYSKNPLKSSFGNERGNPTLPLLQSLPLMAPCLFNLSPTVSHVCPLPCMQFPPSPVCDYLWLINCYRSYLSRVKCHASSISIHNPSIEIPFSRTRWIGGD